MKTFREWLCENKVDKDVPLKYNKDMNLSQKVKVVWNDILKNGDKNYEWFDEAWDIYEMSDRGKGIYKILKGLVSYPDEPTIEALGNMYGSNLIPGYQNGTDQRLANVFDALAEIFNIEDELRDLSTYSDEEEIDDLSKKAKDFLINFVENFGLSKSYRPTAAYKRAAVYLTTGKLYTF